MYTGACSSLVAAWVKCTQSSRVSWPVRRRWESSRASELSIRRTSCALDISMLKMPTVRLWWMAACWAIPMAKLVFPILGRPAITMRSDRWKPAVLSSKSWYPVGTPVIFSWRLNRWSTISMLSLITWLTGTKERPSLPCASLNTDCSANSSSSSTCAVPS